LLCEVRVMSGEIPPAETLHYESVEDQSELNTD
jgi:hypothetical protein